MAQQPIKRNMPRVEPTFSPSVTAYAPPHVREQHAAELASSDAEMIEQLEHDIRHLSITDGPQSLPASERVVTNSADMDKIKQMLANAVTAAHDDAGKALDKVLQEARELMKRIEDRVTAHKKMLNEEGQRIAVSLESAVQELTNTCKWVEQQGPKLRNPQLTTPDTATKEKPAGEVKTGEGA